VELGRFQSGSLHARLYDLMASFDLVSFFRRVLIRGHINLLGQHFEEHNLRLIHHVLTPSYFNFSG
jgi:hypothetical protein